MKKWILLLVAILVLVLLIVRERYTNYEEALADVGQTAGYITPTCETGYIISSDNATCSKDGTNETKSPSCPTGTSFVKRGTAGVCEPTSPGAAETTSSTPASIPTALSSPTLTQSPAVTSPIPSSSPAVTGLTTGGSSTSSRGSTATTGSGKGVWGPAFPGFGENGGPSSGDSTKRTEYPTLLGGFMGSKPSSMVPGVGVVSPSTPGLTLPSSVSLGADANSGFLPYSRQPGDMDVIPDPYRLSKTFSASNYSSKQKEPTPFLADFSAFTK